MSPKKKDGVNESLLDRSNETPPKATFAQLFRYTTLADKLMYVVGCLVSVATGLGMPLMAIVIGDVSQNFMDFEFHRHIGDLNETELHRQFAANVTSSCFNFVSIGTGVFFAATLQSICFLTACESMINRLRRQLFLSIVRQDTTWFDKNQSGTLATKLFDNIERVKEGSGDKIGVIVQNLALFLGGFAVAFSYNWKLTLIMMSLAPFMLICGAAISKSSEELVFRSSILVGGNEYIEMTLVANAATEETQKYAVAGSIAQEVLTAIRTVIVFNGQEKECSRYDRALNDGKKTGIKKSIYLGVGVAATYLIMFSFYGLAFWVGTNYVAEGVIAGGTVMVVFFSVMMGAMSLGQAGPQLAIVGTALGAAGALYQIIDRVPEIDAYSQDGLKPDNVAGRIEVNDLQFTYPTRQDVPILTGISFDVNPGETVALVGSSGCGKSTIMQLLLRYYSPSAGNVTIDGIPLEDFNLEYLRQSIGVVSQEPSLFNTTIEENIRYGRYDVTESELKSALKQSNAYDFVQNLPEGVRTLVGDRGAQLSGGQKQRIAIARALVRNPKILLLDEATSALDAESEHIVQKALEKASKGRTTIVIAHRLSTIKNADKIIVLKAGEIYETGTHEELLLKKGLYYDLVNSQVFTEFEEKTKIADELSYIETSRQFSAMSARSMSTQSGGPQSPMLLQTQLSTIYGNIVSKEKEEKEDELDRLKRECKEEGVVKSNFHSIVKHVKPEWTFLIVALFIASVEGCIFPAFSLFFSQIIQVFAEPDPDKLREQGHFWALMFPMLGVIETVFATSQFFLFGLTAERVTMRLRSKVFRNVLRMDGSFFDKTAHSPGKITTRLATDAPNVRAAIDNRLGSVFGTIVQVICGLSIALYFGWKMAIVVVAIFPLSGIGEYIQIKYMESRITEDAKELENSGKIAMEAIDNIRTVQALTLERRLHHQFCQHLDGPYTTNRRKAVIQSFSFGFAASITFILYAVSFMWGLWLILNNQIMSQDVLRVLFAISFISGSLGSATTYFPEYIKATFAGGLVNKMLKQSPTIDGLSDYGDKPTINGSIWFKDVYFTYPERQDVPILQGLDIRVSPGETLALVGPSGCGKSTVISLLEKLYDPIEGQILIDDNDLSNINASHLRAHIALVSQEPILFDSSIRENICYGIKDEISIEEVIEVAKQANIHSFITSLPKGYDTPVGDKGTQLSGGQKQRIAIARALVRNPRILLLDEATSALDTESEKLVQEALEVASAGRTCVVVAHRLSTVVKANRIVVLNNGRVVEQGTHRELLALKGAYYNLTQKQAISSSE